MSKRYRERPCVYCVGRLASTADHVVARGFFPSSHRHGLPKAPACTRCNKEKSDLEHSLTTVLPFGSEHMLASQMLQNKVGRRLNKNLRLKRELRDGIKDIWAKGKGGLLLPTVALPVEGDMFVRLCRYIIRGLVWYEWEILVPKDYVVDILTLSDDGLALFRDNVLNRSPEFRKDASFADGGFQYTCTRDSTDPALTVWQIRFYQTLNLAGLNSSGRLSSVHVCAITGPKTIRPN